MKLRWIRRTEKVNEDTCRYVKVLQVLVTVDEERQSKNYDGTYWASYEEWQDVPTVEQEDE